MRNLTILISRFKDNQSQTIGQATLLEDGWKALFDFKTLELSWKGNQKRISCIPAGTHPAKVIYSPTYGRCIQIFVDGRTAILIHWGNFYTNTLGCILVGRTHKFINKDRQLDVSSSKRTFNALMKQIEDDDKIQITITSPNFVGPPIAI